MDTALLIKYEECTYTKFTNPALIQKDIETPGFIRQCATSSAKYYFEKINQ